MTLTANKLVDEGIGALGLSGHKICSKCIHYNSCLKASLADKKADFITWCVIKHKELE